MGFETVFVYVLFPQYWAGVGLLLYYCWTEFDPRHCLEIFVAWVEFGFHHVSCRKESDQY